MCVHTKTRYENGVKYRPVFSAIASVRTSSPCPLATRRATLGEVLNGRGTMPRKPVDFGKAKDETTQPAQEVIAHLYKALLKMEPFTLLDGTRVQVKSYQPPEINDAGEAQCGVDVILPNGHLEFTMK